VSSQVSRELEKFENAYKGRKCLIIGNGPSADYARIPAERCNLIIGVNAVELRDLGVKLDWLLTIDAKRSYNTMEKALAVVNTKADHIVYRHMDWVGEWGDRGVRIATQIAKPGKPWPLVYSYNNRRLHPPVMPHYCGPAFTAAAMAVYFGVASIEFIGTDFSDPMHPKVWPHLSEMWQRFAKECAPPGMELINLPPGVPDWLEEYRFQAEKLDLAAHPLLDVPIDRPRFAREADPFPTVTRKLPGDDQ
jgi:hypothetical protein